MKKIPFGLTLIATDHQPTTAHACMKCSIYISTLKVENAVVDNFLTKRTDYLKDLEINFTYGLWLVD